MWYSLHTAACNHFTTHLFVAFWCAPKNCQTGGVFTFFLRLSEHKINAFFFRLGNQEPRYLRCFVPVVAKTAVSAVFLRHHLAKNTGICCMRFSACCKKYSFYMPRVPKKHCNFRGLIPERNTKSKESNWFSSTSRPGLGPMSFLFFWRHK